MDNRERTIALLQTEIDSVNAQSILRECESIEGMQRYIPSGIKWAIDYKRFQVLISEGNIPAATRFLKRAMAFAPYNEDLIRDYRQLFSDRRQRKLLTLIISCKKYEANALRLAQQLRAEHIDYAIISGSDTSPIDDAHAVQVDAPDNYESLPRKVIAAYAWAYESFGGGASIIKIDDDQNLFDAEQFKGVGTLLLERADYAGVPVSGTGHDRCWHWNKCASPELNARVYGKPFLRAWAMGGAYFLSAEAVEKVVLSTIRFPGLFEGEYYEDKLVGDILAMENVALDTLNAYEDFGLRLTEHHRFVESQKAAAG